MDHPHFQAASRAIKRGFLCYEWKSLSPILVYNVVPDFIREGCSIPITLTFQVFIEKNLLNTILLGANWTFGHSASNECLRLNGTLTKWENAYKLLYWWHKAFSHIPDGIGLLVHLARINVIYSLKFINITEMPNNQRKYQSVYLFTILAYLSTY